MISDESGCNGAFVWIWLPGVIEPVVAGKLTADADKLIFNYGKSYLNRKKRRATPEAGCLASAGRSCYAGLYS